jgi:hypothetical protein
MGIRDRIKNKARQAIKKATGSSEIRARSSKKVKAWESYIPTGAEGHEAEEGDTGFEDVAAVVGFSDTTLSKKPDTAGEMPEHMVKALAAAEKTDEPIKVDIDMSLTSPNCPAAQSLPAECKSRAEETDGVSAAVVEVVWEPPWGPELMSEEAKLELNVL